MATAYQKSGYLDKAYDYFSKYHQRCPDDVSVIVQLAQYCFECEQYSQAIRYYQKALDSNVNHHGLMRSLALCFQQLAQYDQALPLMHAIQATYRKDVRYWADLGQCYELQGQYKQAMDSYDKGLAIDQENAYLHGLRAMLRMLISNLKEGFAEYEYRFRQDTVAIKTEQLMVCLLYTSDAADES